MSQINFDRIPGLIVVYKIDNDSVKKIYGKDLNIDLDRLKNLIMENMRIGEEEAKKLKLIDPFLGFAMIVDNMGIVYLNNMIIFAEAKKTNWDFLIKNVLRGVGVYEKS